MGTICAPAYADIFMTQFEKQHIYPYIKNKSLCLRYINNIFMIWTGAKQELFVFLENSNTKHNQTIQSYLKNIPFSQSLRIKTICSSLTEYKRHCAILKLKFIERGYKENILKDQIDRVDNNDRKD